MEEVSATKSAAAARVSYCPHFLLANGLLFPLTISVVESVASSHSLVVESLRDPASCADRKIQGTRSPIKPILKFLH